MGKCLKWLDDLIDKIKGNRVLSGFLKVFVFLLLFSAVILSVGSIQTTIEKTDDEQTELIVVSSSEVASSKAEEKKPVYTNQLTGLPIEEQYVNTRPVSVILNNVDAAQPFYGISQADVIYECLAGGSVTRLMAVYKNPYALGTIGAITSSRTYFSYLSEGLDAIHIHYSSTGETQSLLKNIDNFDLIKNTSMFWRDQNRIMNNGYDYSVMTSGENIKNGIESSNMDKSYTKEVFSQKFSENSKVLQGETCNTMSVDMSFLKKTTFTYDEAGKFYMVSSAEKPQEDANTGAQNTRKNVLALYVNIYSLSANGNELAMDLSGDGNGYYASNGKAIPIKWSRGSEEENFRLMYEDGSLLEMLPGSVYVCLVPLSRAVDIL